jgi:acetoin utilization deacetylase AcuC-like enzyme
LLNNVSIAAESVFRERLTDRVAVVDWDVHHGNGTEQIFYDRADVLTISIHQDRLYPPTPATRKTGALEQGGVTASTFRCPPAAASRHTSER